MKQKQQTNWESAGTWYDQLVGQEGHYYHQHVILPKLIPLLNLNEADQSLLDLACGQGILARHIPKTTQYFGIDDSQSLIAAATARSDQKRNFVVGDISQTLPYSDQAFTHATLILALQNISHPEHVFKEVHRCLKRGGLFVIVLNHPCFRIPRQSHWKVDPVKKLQSRCIDRYLSPLKIPISIHPSKGNSSPQVWSFHYPLSDLSRFLANAGFVVTLLDEWTSDKKSTGLAAKMENRAREEFPLLLAIKAEKS